jgi:hypothetical protein
MVTEGFGCPQISTIAYATNIVADLFIAQMTALAMRIISAERAAQAGDTRPLGGGRSLGARPAPLVCGAA